VGQGNEMDVALPPRMRRALELVYAVDGVIGARVWQWPGRVAIGVSVATAFSQEDTLRRVEVAIAPIRHADEAWDFGLLGGA
jgi:hypothetical protein